MRNGCDWRREGPTARRFITKTPQRPAALVPTAQPLGCSKTTAIVSAGSRGGRGVGGVVGDERGDALEDDPLAGASGRCGPRRRTRGCGRRRRRQPADVARLRRDAEVEELHHPEGVVHHDGDVEGRATPAVALG